jgi:hypothetical protein
MKLCIKALCAMSSCAAMLQACGDDGDGGTAGMSGDACLQPLELECDPRYPATFEQIHQRLIDRTCNAAPCHGVSRAGNLMFGNADAAYARLLNDEVDEPLVIPGDPECSLLMKRLESEDPDFVMPVRDPLDDDELCAIRQWIANGAER